MGLIKTGMKLFLPLFIVNCAAITVNNTPEMVKIKIEYGHSHSDEKKPVHVDVLDKDSIDN